MKFNGEHLISGLVGLAGGIMVSVLYLRGEQGVADRLNELRDGAMLLVVVGLGLRLWQAVRRSGRL